MVKTTKGDWYVSEHEDNDNIVVRAAVGKKVYHNIIANCEVDFNTGTAEEILANAYLIAAAKDLLAGCQAALEVLRLDSDMEEDFASEIEQLLRAIAKTKGDGTKGDDINPDYEAMRADLIP